MASETRPASRAAPMPRMMRGSAGRTQGMMRRMVRIVPPACDAEAAVDGVEGVFDMTLPESGGRASKRDLAAVLWWMVRPGACSEGRRVRGGVPLRQLSAD